MRIDRIGTDSIQVLIRPARDEAEFVALVDRIERLADAGFESISVVFEGAPGIPTQLLGPTGTSTTAAAG